MTNLKKTLAVVLAFAMILSMGAISTFAYSDVAEGTIVSEAVGILSNLNILTGFEDGTFRPDETVTRAQMAAIICRTLGYEDQAQSSMGSTVFNDVAADHWASGYVNVAQAQGIINGYGDGNFGPEDKVTYEQAVKMIVSALGYDLAANAKGGYPTGYLAIASSEGITKNANGRVGDAAARSAIAVLVYNSLEVELMDQNSWSTGSDGDKWTNQTEKTILSQYLDVQKFEGYVSETPLTKAQTSYSKDDKAVISLTGAKYWNFTSGDYVLNTNGIPSTSNINATLVDDVNKFLGKKVVAYIGETADNATGDRMLYAIAEKQGANNSITINASQLVAADQTKNELRYRKPGSTKIYDLALTVNSAYVNFDDTTAATLAAADGTRTSDLATEDFAALLTNGGVIELIDNDTTTGYDTLIITRYDAEAVVKAVEVDAEDIMFDLYTGDLEAIDTEADDELVIVYKDGAVATVEDIAAGDTVSTAQIKGDDVRVLYVSSASVTGTVDGWDPAEKEVSIAGTEYKPSRLSAYYTDVTTLKNKEGIFYLNVDGQIAYADASAAKGSYGLVLNVGKSGSMGKYLATVALADGSVVSYDLATKLTWNNATGTTAEAAATAIAAIMKNGATSPDPKASYDKDEAYTHTDVAAKLICEVKIKDGEIKTLNQLNSGAAAPGSSSKYNAETGTLGSKSFDEASVMFAIKGAYNDTSKIEDTDVQAGKAIELLADEEDYYVTAYEYENKVYGCALGYNLVASIPVDSDAVIVSSKKEVSYNDDTAVQITGLQDGKEVSYIIYNENGYKSAVGNIATGSPASYAATPAEIGKGDVILVSTPNAENVVADFQMIYNYGAATTHYSAGYTRAGHATEAAKDAAKDVYYHAGTIDFAKGATDDYIWFQTAGSNVTTADGASNFVVMQGAANYTLVDFTEDASNPEISKKSANKSIFGNLAKYDSDVFVRVVDEKLVEVVVYRTNANRANITVSNDTAASFAVSSTDGATLTYSVNGGAFGASTGVLAANDVVVVKAVASGKTTNTVAVTVK